MSNEEQVFPLRDCQSCIHNRVCKFIDTFNMMELPINLYETPCNEFTQDYTDEQLEGFTERDVDIEMDEEDEATVLLEAIETELIKHTGNKIEIKAVYISQQDRDRLNEISGGIVGAVILSDGTAIDLYVMTNLSPGQFILGI